MTWMTIRLSALLFLAGLATASINTARAQTLDELKATVLQQQQMLLKRNCPGTLVQFMRPGVRRSSGLAGWSASARCPSLGVGAHAGLSTQ